MKVYNTLTRRKEEFIPLKDNEVRMYVCGVTLYDKLHLGHARAAVVFDVIRRYLEHRGFKVNYVTNFTDVDDKVINRAKSLGTPIFDLTGRLIEEYFQQMEPLGVRRANDYPCATEYIKEIIDLIKKLERKNLAYAQDGDVFFRVRGFPSYGRLSGQDLKELSVGARVKVNERKEDPLDFVVWKKAKEGEPFWDSPWGKGRPGWHIECSAMAMNLLGESIDIHGGGVDLIFPHHENEIAQSEAASGRRFAKYWIHNGLVKMKDQKMAKSTQNVFTLSQALQDYDGETIRFFLLSAHYRSPLDYHESSLREAKSSLERVYNILKRMKEITGEQSQRTTDSNLRFLVEDLSSHLKKMRTRFIHDMDDDFNTPAALSFIFEAVKKANLLLREGRSLDGSSQQVLLKTREKIKNLGDILGLFQKEEKKRLGEQEKKLIEILVNIREKLREKKDWKLADEIRKKLDELGIELEDKRAETVWRTKS
ncbi:cysteine--tRNA ligase [Candidatus Aerophobetes bacterium Ae_b3b]|nr:MAG: cysteine--tRNA ligase [Candidatus Aerophobetes bacterium Ae_b3b]